MFVGQSFIQRPSPTLVILMLQIPTPGTPCTSRPQHDFVQLLCCDKGLLLSVQKLCQDWGSLFLAESPMLTGGPPQTEVDWMEGWTGGRAESQRGQGLMGAHL